MSTHPIAASSATGRHPEEADAVLAKLQKAATKKNPAAPPLTPEAVTWSYQVAQRIGPASPWKEAQLQVGRERLALLKEDLFIGLMGAVGRSRADVPLDNARLLAGPDEALPVEVVGQRPLPLPPEVPRVWLWDPTRDHAPGWAAHRVLDIKDVPLPNHPKGLLVTVQDPEARGRTEMQLEFWYDGQDFHDQLTTRFSQAERQARRQKGRPASDEEIQARIGSFADGQGRWKGALIHASVSELLGQLPTVVQVGGGPLPPDATEVAPVDEGRWFDTHEQLSTAELQALATLEAPTPGVSRASDLFGMLEAQAAFRAPTGEPLKPVALSRVAQGEDVDVVVAELRPSGVAPDGRSIRSRLGF